MAEKAFLIIVGGYLGHHFMKSFHNKILVVPLFNFLCFITFLFATGPSYRWSTMLVELSGLRQDLFQSHLVVSDLHFWQESCISQVIVGKILIDNQVSLSGGGNYETGFTDSILAWNPEMEDWSLVGNMLVARYDRPIYLPTWYHRPDKYVNFQRGFYCCFSQLHPANPSLPGQVTKAGFF